MSSFDLNSCVQNSDYTTLLASYRAAQKIDTKEAVESLSTSTVNGMLAYIREQAEQQKENLPASSLHKLNAFSLIIKDSPTKKCSGFAAITDIFQKIITRRELAKTLDSVQRIEKKRFYEMQHSFKPENLTDYCSLFVDVVSRCTAKEKEQILNQILANPTLLNALISTDDSPCDEVQKTLQIIAAHAYNKGKIFEIFKKDIMPEWVKASLKRVISAEMNEQIHPQSFIKRLLLGIESLLRPVVLTVPPRGNFTQGFKVYNNVERLIAESVISVIATKSPVNESDVQKVQALLVDANKEVKIPAVSPFTQGDRVFLDKNRLLEGKKTDKPISPVFREWFVNQAVLISHIRRKDLDPEVRKQLSLVLLQSYSKAAPPSSWGIQTFDTQASPFLQQEYSYHRGWTNPLLATVGAAYAKDLDVQPYEIQLVNSQNLREVMARELMDKYDGPTQIGDHLDDFKAFIKLGFQKRLQKPSEKETAKKEILDISKLLHSPIRSPQEIKELIKELIHVCREEAAIFLKQHPSMDPSLLSNFFTDTIKPIAFIKYKDQDILYMPDMQKLTSLQHQIADDKPFRAAVNEMIIYNGFRLSPDEGKQAWLNLKDPETILEELHIPVAELATKGTTIPTVCASFTEFLKNPVVEKFKALSGKPNAHPYLKVLPLAAVKLLQGLATCRVDEQFTNKGIKDLLQISYFRMLNAMNEAIVYQNNFPRFNNQIELLHQEIQMMLAILSPHDDQVLASSVQSRMQSLIPAGLNCKSSAYLKPSAMRCLSSALASIEAQKGTNRLHVALLNDTYYEEFDNVQHAKAYEVSVVDGDTFNKKGIEESVTMEKVPSTPFDVFVCEFHHNISVSRNDYHPENILGQVKAMYEKKLAAVPFTVIIDTTINLEQSDDIKKLLDDPLIQEKIQQGKLNIVMLRSGQKFDMLGMDNYYGGIVTTINNPDAFKAFNARMNDPNDQQKGLSYQGMAHLQKYAAENIDQYRQALMDNTHKLYDKLPPSIIYKEGHKETPIQIAKIEDDKTCFLAIKTPINGHTRAAIRNSLSEMAKRENLLFSTRASFGFVSTNLLSISRTNRIRLNIGLDSEETINRYAAFFCALNKVMFDVLADLKGKNTHEIDVELAIRISKLEIP